MLRERSPDDVELYTKFCMGDFPADREHDCVYMVSLASECDLQSGRRRRTMAAGGHAKWG
jgi:hypothetical protein